MKKQLSKSEVKDINDKLQKFGLNDFIAKKDNAEVIEDEKGKRIIINGEETFFFAEDQPVPLLRILLKQKMLKQVVVDMGAVKFVTSGADVMRPGITEFEDGIQKFDYIVVADVNNKKPLCVGIMLFSGEEAQSMPKGKIVKNLHYVGDKLWS